MGLCRAKLAHRPLRFSIRDVSAKAQLGFFAFGLAIEHALRIGHALVRVVAALLAMKVDRRIAGIIIFGGFDFLLVPAILRTKLLRLATTR